MLRHEIVVSLSLAAVAVRLRERRVPEHNPTQRGRVATAHYHRVCRYEPLHVQRQARAREGTGIGWGGLEHWRQLTMPHAADSLGDLAPNALHNNHLTDSARATRV